MLGLVLTDQKMRIKTIQGGLTKTVQKRIIKTRVITQHRIFPQYFKWLCWFSLKINTNACNKYEVLSTNLDPGPSLLVSAGFLLEISLLLLFFFCSIKFWRNQLWAVGKFCYITVIFCPTSSEHHEFVNVGVNWGINASKNRIVCLRRAPSFFPSPPRLDVRCFPSHTETCEPVSELRHSTPHLSHKRTHTPRCCGSEAQPECDRTLLRYASRKFGEGRAPPIHSPNAPLHLRFS